MNRAPVPENEAHRLEAVRRYNILDTPPEPAFDDLTRLAASLCAAPIAYVSFTDERRVWFKSCVGWDISEIPRDVSFCAHAILGSDVFEVEDASRDPRFQAHPLVARPPHLRFFAGTPICSPDGFALGALCVADRQPRALAPGQKEALRILAHQVITHLELRRHLVELERSLTEEQRAKEALRRSENFYETLVESLPQFILRKDRQGRLTFVNQKFADQLGRPREEVLGKNDWDLYPPHLAEKYHRDDLRVMATREPIDTIEANQLPDGSTIFVHVIKTPILDSDGNVIGIQGIFWDVTERKKIEEALAYERDLLRALLENVPDRVYFKDVASRFLRCSHSLARRLGVADPKDVIGKTDFDFYPREQAQEYYQDEQRIILTGRPLINKVERSVGPDGTENWASVTKVPIYNRNGSIMGLVGISRDITMLKQAEEALEQARDAALETARVKSEFLANMSHEIRTPLNAMVGMMDLLADTHLDPQQREFVETARQSTATLLAIINDILDFSKMEAGKLLLESLDFDLRELLESTAQMLAERAQSKGLELICWVEDNVPTRLRGDPGRIRQVLANLLSNAVKFTERGEVVLRASLERETTTQATVRVTVQDTGIGIAPKTLPLIFQAFTQADGSTTRKYGGTGLGLAISKKLVELMGGQITVDSTPGQGSTFGFTLPLDKQPTRAPIAPTPAPPSLEGRRVLVVDDNATNRQILRHQLDKWKLRNDSASHGIKALSLLRQAARAGDPYALALLDMQMPEMDGLMLAKAIKADPAIAATRLVLLTSMSTHLDEATMRTGGIEACLVKPIKQSRLFDTLATVLSAAQLPSGASAQLGPSAPPPAEFKSRVRILLAEDNLVNQRLALKQLEKLGYAADAVANGREVLEAVQKTPYDIILLDCQMPEMDGYEVARRLRQSQPPLRPGGSPAPHIIALTANALEGDRERGLAAGMNDYLTKPVRLPELRQAIERALRHIGPRPARDAGPADDALDASVLASLQELREPGQPDPLAELIRLYLRDAKPKIESLEGLAAARKARELKSVAHSLKGSSSNLGARALATLFRELEEECKAGRWDRLDPLLPRIRSEFERVQSRLLAALST